MGRSTAESKPSRKVLTEQNSNIVYVLISDYYCNSRNSVRRRRAAATSAGAPTLFPRRVTNMLMNAMTVKCDASEGYHIISLDHLLTYRLINMNKFDQILSRSRSRDRHGSRRRSTSRSRNNNRNVYHHFVGGRYRSFDDGRANPEPANCLGVFGMSTVGFSLIFMH